MHFYLLFDILKLCHHVFINMQTSCSIENHYVMTVLLCVFNSSLCDIYRAVIISHSKYINLLLFSIDLQLFDCCRSINIAGYQQGFLTLQFQLSCNLRSCGRLTGTLQTTHHNGGNCLTRLHLNLGRLGSH